MHTLRQGGSGSILADKRYGLAQAFLEDGDVEAAADLFAQAAEEAPTWAAAHLGHGLALEMAGRLSEAIDALRLAADHDHDGLLGAALHLARLGAISRDCMPAAYVTALFDEYAPRFDHHLVDGLAYRGPAVIMDAIDRAAPPHRFGPTLDLGCGTGLMARALAGRAGPIDGIDLSPGMLAEAAATGLYRSLHPGDGATTTRMLAAGSYDLAVAADVLVYLGDLAPLFAAVARILRPGGVFAATVQAGSEDFSIGPDLRFRHGADYVRATLASAGFEPPALEPCVTRREGGADVPGLVFVAHRP